MSRKKPQIVDAYARLWPREVFDGKPALADTIEFFKKHPRGVYVLYHDDRPYYIGRSDTLLERLKKHARPQSRYYNFWNLFSAFAISTSEGCKDLEAMLIAALPTANSAEPTLKKETLPREVITLMRQIRNARLG
jgi:predicted GIY-YIG superfamily endonuclease